MQALGFDRNPDIRDYHAAADEAMEHLVTYFEALTESYMDQGADVEYSVSSPLSATSAGGGQYQHAHSLHFISSVSQSGVMNLNVKEGMTYVLNKQPPNKQIWLSSPLSCVPPLSLLMISFPLMPL